MPEWSITDGIALTSSTLHWGLEAVRKVVGSMGPLLDVPQLGFPFPVPGAFWGNDNEAGTDVQPAASTGPIHWCEVGWIFRQDQCIAIERMGLEVRERIMVA